MIVSDAGVRSGCMFSARQNRRSKWRGVFRSTRLQACGNCACANPSAAAVTETSVDESLFRPHPVGLAAKLDARTVWTHDEAEVQKFLRAKPTAAGAAKRRPFVIAIDSEQPWVPPAAEKFAADLQALGRAAKVVRSRVTSCACPTIGGPPGAGWRAAVARRTGRSGDVRRRPRSSCWRSATRTGDRSARAARRAPGSDLHAFPRDRQSRHRLDAPRLLQFSRYLTILANDDAGLRRWPRRPCPRSRDRLPCRSRPAHILSGHAPDRKPPSSSKGPTTLRDAFSAEDRVRSVDVDAATGACSSARLASATISSALRRREIAVETIPSRTQRLFRQWIMKGVKSWLRQGQDSPVPLDGETGRISKNSPPRSGRTPTTPMARIWKAR